MLAIPDVAPAQPASSGMSQGFPTPILSSMPQAWTGIVVEIYRAQDINFADAQSEHVVSLHVRGSNPSGPDVGQPLSLQIAAGDINITPAGESRRWRYDGAAEIAVLRIAPSSLDALVQQETGQPAQSTELAGQSGIRDAQIEHLCAGLLDELTTGGLATRMRVQLLSSLLAIHLLRRYSKVGSTVGDPSSKLARHKLRKVTDYIDKNLHSDLSLGRVAESLGMSSYHFAHLFKATTGQTPHGYVARCRMDRAKSLLRESNFLVNEIAGMVGYPSQSRFAAVFRQLTGQTPLRYRNRGSD